MMYRQQSPLVDLLLDMQRRQGFKVKGGGGVGGRRPRGGKRQREERNPRAHPDYPEPDSLNPMVPYPRS